MLGTSQLGISFSAPFISYRRSSIALLRTAYLCCAFTVLCSALPCISYLCYAFAHRGNAMRFPCIAVKAAPVLCQDVPSYAMPLQIGKIHCPALLVRAWLGIAFPLPFHASPLLLFSMPRLAFPLLPLAYQFLCRSIHCDDVPLLINSIPSCANPLQINSWLCAAFALLSCALPCHPLLCPCAADQETSAQRKRPLPELRH